MNEMNQLFDLLKWNSYMLAEGKETLFQTKDIGLGSTLADVVLPFKDARPGDRCGACGDAEGMCGEIYLPRLARKALYD